MRHNESILDAAVESWPGLAALIIRNNAAEIHKKKAVDGNAFKLFRRFIAVAQDGSRSGQYAGQCPGVHDVYAGSSAETEEHAASAGSSTLLLWRAAKLFTHVREVLTISGMSTVIGAEYAAVLRTHLLSTPAYCDCAKPEDAQGARAICMLREHRCPQIDVQAECIRFLCDPHAHA